jgi:hypothetical protein
MSNRNYCVALLAAALAVSPAGAQPGGAMLVTYPNGTVGYGENTAPTSETSIGPQTVVFSPGAGVIQLADNFQAGSGPALANLLTNSSPDDLNDTGLPYSGMPYFADAFQWTLTIPGGGAQSVQSSLITAHAVPEPNPLLLIGPVAAVLAAARRRRCLAT